MIKNRISKNYHNWPKKFQKIALKMTMFGKCQKMTKQNF